MKKIKIEKPLCKLKKDQLAAVLPILAAEIAESRFICRRCGRAAKSKKWLCKPEPIEKFASDGQGGDGQPTPQTSEQAVASPST